MRGVLEQPARPLRGYTILVVEDDPESADLVRRLLELLGAQVAIAYDGREGLNRLVHIRADAVLCDLGMPVMDGLEFARHVRGDFKNRRLLLVAVTGRQQHTDFLETWEAGYDAHLVKPVTLAMLERLAQRLYGRRVESGA